MPEKLPMVKMLAVIGLSAIAGLLVLNDGESGLIYVTISLISALAGYEILKPRQ